jgi:Ca2+-transporting ATPase
MPPYQHSVADVARQLATDVDCGLTATEARQRLERFGPNQLRGEPPVAAWRKFLAQFGDMLVVLLLVATAISIVVWVYERDSPLPYEAIAISAVVLLNAVLGYAQEERAESAIALRDLAAAHALALRDGVVERVRSTDIVPGDILAVEEGDTVPADARVIQSTVLHTAEAALTGESLPVAKDVAPIAREVSLGDQANMIFSGTTVTYGRGRAIVVATGMQTRWAESPGCCRASRTNRPHCSASWIASAGCSAS